MVVFKITNTITGKNYIGTSFNSGFQRFEQYVEASADEDLTYPLYEDIRASGPDAFVVEELFETSDKEELYELEKDYVSIYNGESLRGYKIGQSSVKAKTFDFGKKAMFDTSGNSTAEPVKKTARGGRKAAATKKIDLPEKPEPTPSAKSFFGELIGEDRLDTPTTATASDPKKPSEVTQVKRTKASSASLQRMLKEAEKQAKKEREDKLKAAQQEQAEEMAMIMAKIDITSKTATSAFRRKKG
ncbi:GIY-YIG nuclease family protein [Marinomonas mediterranea]|uniref:GIY-YIG domain-containing protein n=1 Tax=Marinomonas mediterranea (strain ATCC 700492 / JCM 21426 / NBRC 103028 / MMB-1) TaxID=717774 RepID=F2JVV2_MARM1|nr:GIY-YIG nuclease family protein [Marinomonas mediterranea]ADZ91738.1 hypothetical protein Marme_2506 [Marinomonas mediterranea MMB-1]WCN09698.1 GIY-YIG nuclease family protein [Marinomonas mediterranea]WCN13779.1 GIY-YIG nuclease family protein [Marinomonas mediterranea]WCN17834.1 GIY-YIG nuclease family protein [Marinomonas mediterranea MMB-1]